MDSIIYTDIAVVMLFMFISMLFTYLYSGLFDVGADNKTLERAGMCSVIFTVIYFLAPFYVYTLSIGYIASFVLTFIAANSGINNSKIENEKENKNKKINSLEKEVKEVENSDEEIISRFAVNLINHDGVLSDMTRGALVGLLCGVALGDTAGAVTLGICGLVSGLFFSQSTVLAIISGLVSAASYSIYVTGIDAIQRYIPNMMAGLTFYMPASMFYASIIKKIKAGKYNKKTSPLLDKGLLITELPANKLNNLSDAFQGLSGIFYEISERLKTPNATEIKAIVAACFEKTCEKCGNYEYCPLIEKQISNNTQKKCVDFLIKNGRLNTTGISKIFIEQCVKITEIQNKINAVYCSKTEENIENDKTKIFADNYENIAKLLQNNIKSGKEDIAFKKDMSEKIYVCLENMGIECENVIVMGERKKTVYIFGIKMVNYAGKISDITDMLERICGTCFDYPEYILRENNVIMKNQSRNKFKIYSMQMSKAAKETNLIAEENIPQSQTDISNIDDTNVNGDSLSVFNGKDGYQYGLISDGMGSGKNAALSSRLTVLLVEKLLSAGNQKDLTIEMINSLLISKNDECFASVDLFEADLITGKGMFIKAGAAPSFVIRNGKLFKIQSSTVPAGIIKNINSEQTKFDMEDGDYIIMLSDGIISTFEEGAWLFEMLNAENNFNDPQMLLNNILQEAYKKNYRKDDMSVLFMKIAEERTPV
jgi:stage II sporulation protein E